MKTWSADGRVNIGVVYKVRSSDQVPLLLSTTGEYDRELNRDVPGREISCPMAFSCGSKSRVDSFGVGMPARVSGVLLNR